MFCKNCGQPLAEDATFCPNCGKNQANSQQVICIKTHMTDAILVTIFCCVPFGIIAIVNAARVSGLVASKNYDAAQAVSNNAKKWVWISFIVGLVSNILVLAVNFLGALAEMAY